MIILNNTDIILYKIRKVHNLVRFSSVPPISSTIKRVSSIRITIPLSIAQSPFFIQFKILLIRFIPSPKRTKHVAIRVSSTQTSRNKPINFAIRVFLTKNRQIGVGQNRQTQTILTFSALTQKTFSIFTICLTTSRQASIHHTSASNPSVSDGYNTFRIVVTFKLIETLCAFCR